MIRDKRKHHLKPGEIELFNTEAEAIKEYGAITASLRSSYLVYPDTPTGKFCLQRHPDPPTKGLRGPIKSDEEKAENRRGQREREKVKRLKASSKFPEGTPDNERFSVSGEKKHAIESTRTTRHEKFEVDKARLAEEGFPKPKIVDLEAAHPVLDSFKDVALRERTKNFLGILLEGGLHKKALNTNDFSWNHIQNLFQRNPGLRDLYTLCKQIGEEYRTIVRIDAAHERATEGVSDPIYSNSGKYLGSRQLYSDRLLELLIKADAPDKFNPNSKVSIEGTTLSISFGFDREKLKEEAAEVEEADFEEL